MGKISPLNLRPASPSSKTFFMNPPTSLNGKRALITGASSGIGRAITRALDSQGCSVALCARRKDRLQEVAGELKNATICTADLAEEDQLVAAVNHAKGAMGGLDILINSAGIARQASLIDGKTSDWTDMLQVNVLALAQITREALRHFPESGGHIIHLSSMSGHRVPGRGGFYSATKFAVRAMTEGLRQELRHKGNLTRVGCISPGFVDTELLDEYFQVSGDDQAKYESIGYPILQPEEIAELVVHQLTMPETAEVTDILVRPTGQAT